MVKNLNPFNVLRGVFAIVHLFILVFIQSLRLLSWQKCFPYMLSSLA